MYLALSNGTTTITLNNDTFPVSAGLHGARYFPSDGGEAETVTETIEEVFNGSVTDVRATFAAITRLLTQATERSAGNLRIPALYLLHNPVGAALGAYRSEITGGQVVWNSNRLLRQMHSTYTSGENAIIITRVNYFEDINEATAATNFAIVNGDNLPLNYVAMNSISGDLATPLRIAIKNDSGADVLAEDFYLTMDTFVGLGTSEHFLAGDSATWVGSLADGTMIVESAIPDAVLTKCAGEEMSIIAAFSALSSNVYLRPVIYTVRDGLYLESIRGKEVYSGGRKLINLGSLPIPASGYSTGTSGTVLGIVGRCSTGGEATMMFQQITPARDMINLYYNDYDMVHGAQIVDDGSFAYYEESGAKFDTVFRTGGPLKVWPNKNNRLTILMDEGAAFTESRQFRITAYYRPRRRTV